MLLLKILDDKDEELELIRDRYQSAIPEKFQWRNWATDAEGITGDELILFIDNPIDGLFVNLRQLKAPHFASKAQANANYASEPDLATAMPGFVDRLIHGAAQAAGATMVTFEKSAGKLPNTHVLEG